MRKTTAGILLASALVLIGCGGPKSEVMPEEAVNFGNYRHIGVAPFTDRTGRGKAVADAIDAVFQEQLFDPVDEKALGQVLEKYKPDREMGYSVEALLLIRSQSGADALIMGRMVPDWSAASVSMMETETGTPILHAVLRPHGRGKKFFASPEEVAKEFARIYAKLR